MFSIFDYIVIIYLIVMYSIGLLSLLLIKREKRVGDYIFFLLSPITMVIVIIYTYITLKKNDEEI